MSAYSLGYSDGASMGGLVGVVASLGMGVLEVVSKLAQVAGITALVGGAGLLAAGGADAAGWASLPFVAQWGAQIAPHLAAAGIGTLSGTALTIAGATIPAWIIPAAIAFSAFLAVGLLFGYTANRSC